MVPVLALPVFWASGFETIQKSRGLIFSYKIWDMELIISKMHPSLRLGGSKI